MCILTAVLVLQNAYLDIDGQHVVLLLSAEQLGLQGNDVPARRLLQVQKLHFLQILEMVASPDGYLVRGVRFVRLEVQIDGQLLCST